MEDIGAWLGCPPEAVFNFDYTYRPVPLDVHVLGYASGNNPFLFNRHLEERVRWSVLSGLAWVGRPWATGN